MARAARGRPVTLLGWVCAVGVGVTTVFSLDATVVLFTPVVLATAAASGLAARPHAFVTVHLANSASLLLPVSNLTNLLAFSAVGLGFGRFALLMLLPTLAVLAVEYVVARLFFAGDLRVVAPVPPAVPRTEPPWFALLVVAGTLAGLSASSVLDVEPGVVAGLGAGALAVHCLAVGRLSLRASVRLVRWADPLFLLFVLALGVLVRAVAEQGLGDVVRPLARNGPGFWGLLATATVAAVLANCVNNLPAILLLLPPLAAGGPGPVLAALIGVNVGPNLTYVGSLATMLWRRVLNGAGLRTSGGGVHPLWGDLGTRRDRLGVRGAVGESADLRPLTTSPNSARWGARDCAPHLVRLTHHTPLCVLPAYAILALNFRYPPEFPRHPGRPGAA